VLSKPVRDKLHFVHEVIQQSAGKGLAGKGLALGAPDESDTGGDEKLTLEHSQLKKAGTGAPASKRSPAIPAG
jgi:hypothetical protein